MHAHFRRLASLLALLALAGASPALHAQFIAYYSFEQGTGDDTGLGHDGTATNLTATASGYRGNAYEFDGQSSFLDLPNLDINPDVLPQLTFGAWVRASAINPIRQIISHDDGGLDRSLGLDSRSGLDGWSAFAGNGWIAGETAQANVWTFVALSLDQTTNTAMLYVDGRTYTFPNTAYGRGWTYTRIGMNPSFGEYFAGTIDEVFFYNGALTATQLATISADGLAAIPEPSTWALSALGLLALAATTQRRHLLQRPPGR